ncbi:hypothetical protein GCM10027341_22050 [Spirosoma knui]
MTKKQFIEQVARPAIQMKVGGFRPTDQPWSSWVGKVLLAKEDNWPHWQGVAMFPLCQLYLEEFPVKPTLLSDITLLTVFVAAQSIPDAEDANGTSWCLRAYTADDDLIPLTPVRTTSPIKPFQMLPEVINQDFPHYDDCPIPIPDKFSDDYSDLFPSAGGIKLGGWPTLIQGEIDWRTSSEGNDIEFAFQVDSLEKAHWQWGDNGVAYFGRSRANPNLWAFSWQCY